MKLEQQYNFEHDKLEKRGDLTPTIATSLRNIVQKADEEINELKFEIDIQTDKATAKTREQIEKVLVDLDILQKQMVREKNVAVQDLLDQIETKRKDKYIKLLNIVKK